METRDSNQVWTDNIILEESKSTYILPAYKIFFSDQLAHRYRPILYSNECLSGPPKALFYRIVWRNDHQQEKNEISIQYFFYWNYQLCLFSSHSYDYEPILIYLRRGMQFPYLIVNGGFAGIECKFHKNEIRPTKGKRSTYIRHFLVNVSPKPYYPFGGVGEVTSRGCSKQYPLNNQLDLQFENFHPIFGIRACSNVFSGAVNDLRGEIFNPILKRLTDRVLDNWYFKHSTNKDDMPFGHDISDPFVYPYIKYHPVRV